MAAAADGLEAGMAGLDVANQVGVMMVVIMSHDFDSHDYDSHDYDNHDCDSHDYDGHDDDSQLYN